MTFRFATRNAKHNFVCQPYQYKNSARKVWICRDFFVTLQGNKSSYMMENKGFKVSQYACAVLLIVSSIGLVAYQVIEIDDVATGLLYYVAQSFLLAGSIFGLDHYIKIINKNYHEKQ